MKILCLSDLHMDVNGRSYEEDILPYVITYIKKKDPDIVLIAGDISDYPHTTINALTIIKHHTQLPILFIPGNHDIWAKHQSTSLDAYNMLKNHESSLINKPYHVNEEYVIIGDMGWYDYSFGPEAVHESVFWERKKSKWKDGMYAKWNMTDTELCHQQIQQLKEQLDQNQHKKVILTTHFVPFKEFIMYTTGDANWNMNNGYMGSTKMGELIQSYSNIKWVVFGHTHKRYGVIEQFKGTNLICNPLGYMFEWKTPFIEEELETCGTIITI